MRAPMAVLGDVVDVKGGGTPSKANAAFWTGDIPWVSPKDMKFWEIEDAEDKITPDAIKGSATSLIPVNSILLVNRSGILKHTLPVGITRRPVAINQDVKALICRPHADPNYIARIVKSAEPIILKWVRATTADNFPIDNLRSLEIPLPSLEEQRRIAAVLDKADALRSKRKCSIQLLDRLTKSIFLEMFGDPAKNSKGWPIQNFGTLVVNESAKRIPVKSSDRDQRDGPFPYYGASGIIDYIDDFLFEGKRLLIAEDGANLLSRSTPAAFFAEGKYWVNNHAHVLAETSLCNLMYLRSFIEAIDLTPYVTGSAQPKLNRANMDQIKVPTPPRDMQNAFQSRVEQAEALIVSARRAATKSENLFASLQSRAFSGQL